MDLYALQTVGLLTTVLEYTGSTDIKQQIPSDSSFATSTTFLFLLPTMIYSAPSWRAKKLPHGMGSGEMATILVADYGRDDFLALGSPLVSTLRAWGYEVVEAENSLDVLQQASRVHPDAVVLYDTLPALEALRTMLYQHVATQNIPVLILHEQVQQMQFTDMVMVDPQYRLGKSPRQFDPHELQRLLDQVFA